MKMSVWSLKKDNSDIQQVSHTLTCDELGLEGWGVATEVNIGTLLQDERVFLVKWVTT